MKSESLTEKLRIYAYCRYLNDKNEPQPSTLAVLRHPKARVRVSHYGDRSRYLDRWRALTDVRVRVLESRGLWNDFGPLERTEKPQAAAEEQFAGGDPECFSFYQGNIYCCPRAGHGSDLGVIRLSDREVAHIRTSESAAKRQKEIEKLKGIRYSEACYYCLSGTDRFKRIDYE